MTLITSNALDPLTDKPFDPEQQQMLVFPPVDDVMCPSDKRQSLIEERRWALSVSGEHQLPHREDYLYDGSEDTSSEASSSSSASTSTPDNAAYVNHWLGTADAAASSSSINRPRSSSAPESSIPLVPLERYARSSSSSTSSSYSDDDDDHRHRYDRQQHHLNQGMSRETLLSLLSTALLSAPGGDLSKPAAPAGLEGTWSLEFSNDHEGAHKLNAHGKLLAEVFQIRLSAYFVGSPGSPSTSSSASSSPSSSSPASPAFSAHSSFSLPPPTLPPVLIPCAVGVSISARDESRSPMCIDKLFTSCLAESFTIAGKQYRSSFGSTY